MVSLYKQKNFEMASIIIVLLYSEHWWIIMRKYSIEVGQISPSTCSFSEIIDTNAYLGISLSNPNFYGKKLGALLGFLNRNFQKVLIVTFGYLYRHNFKIINSCSEKQALEFSLSEEERYISREINNYRKIISHEKFIVTSWTEHFITDDFQKSLNSINYFYNKNIQFKNEIDNEALNFLQNSKFLEKMGNKGADLVNVANLKSSVDFLLEEAAFFNYIVKKGFHVGIYPGMMMTVLNDISKNIFPDAPDGLKGRINVPLKLKRIGHRCITMNEN